MQRKVPGKPDPHITPLENWRERYESQAEETLEAQLQLEQAQQQIKNLTAQLQAQGQLGQQLTEMQKQVVQLNTLVETWKSRALQGENRLIEYAPLDRQLLETQQQLLQLQQLHRTEHTHYQQAQERVLNLERHILQLKAALELMPPAPKPRTTRAVRRPTNLDLPPFCS